MTIMYYGRDGQPITWEQWAAMIEQQDARRVALTEVATPSGQRILVSTVLIGLDMNYTGEGPPIIFETMTFDLTPSDDADPTSRYDDIEMRRYATEAEALAGHQETVQWLMDFGYTPVALSKPQRIVEEP